MIGGDSPQANAGNGGIPLPTVKVRIEEERRVMKKNPLSVLRTGHARKIAMTGMFSAVATVLMFLNFSVPFMPPFIKFDISELPALLASFSIGPWSGVAVCLIKNLINLIQTTTGGVGELANFLLGAAFVLPAGYFYRYARTRRSALLGSVIGVLLMAGIGVPINYFVTYPIYAKILPVEAIVGMYQAIFAGVDGLLSCLLVFNLPFTILKGAVNTALAFLLYKRISPFIKGVPKGEKT